MEPRLRAYVESPDGWGPAQLMITRLERLGYDVTHLRKLGRSLLVLR
jgi:hypothetical protein